MQETRIRSLIREDPTNHRAAKPASLGSGAREPQLLRLVCPRAPALRQEKPVQQRRPSTAKSENIIFFKGVQPRAAPGQRVNDTRPVTGVILQGSTSLAGAVPGAAMGAGGPGRALERAAGR